MNTKKRKGKKKKRIYNSTINDFTLVTFNSLLSDGGIGVTNKITFKNVTKAHYNLNILLH